DADLAAGPEAALISDFFDFVDAHYRSVGPYSTLGRCGGIEERIRRRCRTVVEEATDKKAYGPSRGHGPYVEIEGAASLPRRVAFDHDEQDRSLRLSFWPADTPSQAHAFYSDHPLLQRIESMIESGHWKAVGNMHFGHFSAGYAWLPLPSDTSIEQYIAFWRDNVDLIATVYEPPRQPDWDNLLDKLEDERIASSRQPFEKDFMQTGRSKADVRPGVELYRSWPIEEAIDLDDRGELVGQVRDAFDLALKTFAG
ncbi:MAG: hypothetical protein ACTHLH_03510, partial [Solirubrobacterales bacterium]